MATLIGGRGLILAQNRPLRLFTIFILYVAQGVPIGLFWFAIPTWMAANGAGATDVGYVLGFTSLPWTLKLVNGFIMYYGIAIAVFGVISPVHWVKRPGFQPVHP